MTTIRQVTRTDGALYRAARLRGLTEDPSFFASSYEAEAQLSDREWAERAERMENGATAAFLAIEGEVVCGLAEAVIDPVDASRATLAPLWVASSEASGLIRRDLMDAARAWVGAQGVARLRVVFQPELEITLKVHCKLRERRARPG